jgi:hypothetical protein
VGSQDIVSLRVRNGIMAEAEAQRDRTAIFSD